MHIVGGVSDPHAYSVVSNEVSKPRLMRLDWLKIQDQQKLFQFTKKEKMKAGMWEQDMCSNYPELQKQIFICPLNI